jgi:RimJ/RimL family protein N-acetyltransferase
MGELPLTRIAADLDKQADIRAAVRAAQCMADNVRLARAEDADALTVLLADPRVSAPIYTLPEPIDRETVAAFIDRHLGERERGEGLLLVGYDEAGAVCAYHDIQVWPQWAACELGGAIRPDRQNRGRGSAGAMGAFAWLFEVIGVDLICETAALDNVRTANLLERIGFAYKGEVDSKLAGGGVRRSHCWELTKDDWRAR